MAESSFLYRKIFPGNTILVFIPHEDDEINVAGATIYGARKEGFRVIVVFATNGDRSFLAETRIGEAEKALEELGVPEEDIIILGYPDGGLDAARSPYVHGTEASLTVDGRSETYGISGKPEFCMAHFGHHRKYTKDGFLKDVENLILAYTPDTIIGVDFDTHPDHRMCSMALEISLGHILNRPGNTYYPLVLKEFAYNTGFESVKDFYAPHLYSTTLNRKRLLDDSYETDNPPYRWEERLRLPVMPPCREPLMSNNVIYHALCWHVSQRAFLKAAQIINGDQLFWLRRSNNLAMQGKTEVSSGNGEALHDFRMLSTADISVKKPVLDDVLWTPEGNDQSRWCKVTFAKPCRIEEVKLYGNIEKGSRILNGRLTFSNGYTCETGPMPLNGQANTISFPPQDCVSWIRFKMLKTEGNRPGLTEWEIFEKKELPFKLLKILVNNHFAYDWTIFPGEKVEIGAWSRGTEDGIIWALNGEDMPLAEINRYVETANYKTVTIRAQHKEEIWDEITLSKNASTDLRILKIHQKLDQCKVWWYKQKIKRVHHQLRKLKWQEKEKMEV